MAKQQSRQVAAKVKTAFSLSPKAFKRSAAACVYLDQSQSELVESLINAQLAGYRVVNDPAKSVAQSAQVISETFEHQSNLSAAQVA